MDKLLILMALTEIMANSNPELMEMIADGAVNRQIEAERKGNWWDKLTGCF